MIPDNSNTEEVSDGEQLDGETQTNTDNGNCIIDLIYCMYTYHSIDFKGAETDTESTKQGND